ncbi:MAG: regulatory protein RecX [Geminicoccaceae bacterium]
MVDAERAALDVALRALAHRDLSTVALRAKLTAAGIDDSLAEQTVERLVRDGLVNDERAAAVRAAGLAGRGYGDRAIDGRLERDGFDRSCREGALAGLEPEEARARAIAGSARERDLRRVAAGLERRGFGPDAVESALVQVDAQGEAELR